VESVAFDGVISATIKCSMASAGSSAERATAMATLPPLCSMDILDSFSESELALHGMTKERNVRE